MKTMKDFEGSKGDLTLMPDLSIESGNCTIYTAYTHWITKEEASANAKLFSNSKKVLEAAINSHQMLIQTREHRKALNLTVGNIFLDSCISELEEAINNSL